MGDAVGSRTQVLCARCGTTLPSAAAFCPSCGSPTNGGPVSSESREQFLLRDIAKSFASLYAVGKVLGTGGASIVVLAKDPRRNCDVALKVLRPDLAASLHAERFLREIDITRSLQHASILPLYDSGQVSSVAALGGSYTYFTVPFVIGESLERRLSREGQLPIADAIRITGALADALQYAHDQGVLHRDVKPSNVYLWSDRRVTLSDFGVARAMVMDDAKLTGAGVIIGTPTYMSPEQATSSYRLDGRTDQYSLACVTYEMLTGEPPFRGGDAFEAIQRRMTERVPSMRTVRDTIPPHVDDAVLRGLQRLPADRFERISEFAAALRSERPGAGVPMWGPLPTSITQHDCFVLMPFGEQDNLQEAYRDHIVPAIEGCGFRAYRADDLFSHREVIRDIWTSIGSARLVVADLTGRNANVFYELGMAHAIGKDVILLAQHVEDIPFDVGHLRYIRYEYTPRGVVKLREALTAAVKAFLAEHGGVG